MKLLSRLMAVLAILVSIVWAAAFLSTVRLGPPVGPSFLITRGCIVVSFVDIPQRLLDRQERATRKNRVDKSSVEYWKLWPSDGAIFLLPSYSVMSDGDKVAYHTLVIPHWLTNLIAWSLFFILWRKSRKHPKGHCQSCGYDLTGNESGACPECSTMIEANP